MRAARILQGRPERAIVALAELCEERKDEELVVAPPYNSRPATLPPQTPYTVGSGSQTLRPKIAERFSPPAQFFEPGPRQVVQPVTLRPPPEHMAPKRGKWTSPPPPEAPSADHTLFESQLGKGLQLATASTEAREKEAAYNSSESNSEVYTDDGSDVAEDDLRSVRSYTEGTSNNPGLVRRPSWHTQDTIRSPPAFNNLTTGTTSRSPSSVRGRYGRASEKVDSHQPSSFRPPPEFQSTSRLENRRSLSGLPRSLRTSLSSNTPPEAAMSLPSSPDSPMDTKFSEPSNVFYQTTTTRSPRPTALYPTHGTHLSFLSHYSPHTSFMGPPQDIFPPNLPPSLTSMNPRAAAGPSSSDRASGSGPETPTPATYSHLHHSHSLSSSTITALTPPPTVSKFSALPPSPLYTSHDVPSPPNQQGLCSPQIGTSASASPAIPASSPVPIPHFDGRTKTVQLKPPSEEREGLRSQRQHSAGSSTGHSPGHSSTGYSTPISRSPSPHSLSPSSPLTAGPTKHAVDEKAFRASFAGLAIGDASTASGPNLTIVVRVEQDENEKKALES
jgi:terminal uridylyltransferase